MPDATTLDTLHEHVRTLVACGTEQAVADTAVDAAVSVGADGAALFRTGGLTLVSASGSSVAETLARRTCQSESREGDPAAGRLAFPVDEFGALVVETDDGFEDDTVALLGLLATNVEAALAQTFPADGARQSDALPGKLLELVRDVNRALARVSTRDDIERVVCEALTRPASHTFAWFGSHTPTADAIEPNSWAGIGTGYLDDRTVSTDGSAFVPDVVSPLVDDHEVVVLDDLPAALPDSDARAARDCGFESAAFVPVADGESMYGVLALYAERSFDERSRAVLGDLGGVVALALRTVEQNHVLIAGETTEVEFEIADDGITLVELSERADCDLTLDGLLLDGDDQLRMFVSAAAVTPAEFRDAAAATDAVSSATLLADRPESLLFRVVTDRTPMAAFLAEQGIVLRSVTLASGSGRAVVELHADADVRTVVERVQSAYPDTEFVAQRDEPDRPRLSNEFRALIETRLTDRQHETLETAFHSGFYEWPRENSGEDLAASLDIAQPTFLQHLRAAERKLLSAFFDERRFVYSRAE